MGEGVYDVAVLGLGAMGSATLLRLAEGGAKTLGLDRHRPPHVFGSTHGESRVTRRALGEGPAYAPLVARSHEIWRELEARTGESLLHETGVLILGYPQSDFVRTTIAVAERFGLPHEILDAAEIRRRFPQFDPQDDEIGYFELGGGYVSPERCVETQLRLAEAAGAQIRLAEVASFGREGGVLRLETSEGPFRARKLVVSAGGGAGKLLGGPFQKLLKPTLQVMHWFALDPEWAERWASGPSYIWRYGPEDSQSFYGFPAVEGAAKLADAQDGPAVDPLRVDRTVPEACSLEKYDRHVAPRLKGLKREPLRAATCIYTQIADGDFLVDWSPQDPDVLILSPCSGHGFKHSAALGEAAAQLIATGSSRLDLSAFSAARLLG